MAPKQEKPQEPGLGKLGKELNSGSPATMRKGLAADAKRKGAPMGKSSQLTMRTRPKAKTIMG